MRVALVGSGYWGSNHARVLGELRKEGRISELIVCDTDPARAAEQAKRVGGIAETDPRRLVGRVDAVDLCTPTPTHFPLAKMFLEGGADVFVEKPLAGTSKESAELVALAGRKGRILQVGHIFRYHAGVNEIRRRIQAGLLGRVHYMVSNRQSFREPRVDMGVLQALAVHEVDLFPYLLGVGPERIYASLGSFHRPGIEEVAQLILDFPGGTKAYSFESWLSPLGARERKLTVVGSLQSVELDYLVPGQLRVSDSRLEEKAGKLVAVEDKPRMEAVPASEPLRVELEAFLDSHRTRGQPLADAACGHEAVRMIEAAFLSAREGRAVALP